MARVTLTFPESVVYSEAVVLRTTDMSQAGHLGFDQLVRVVHHVLNRYFDRCGLPIRGGIGISYIVKDLAVVYQGEAHAGDTLAVDLALEELGVKSTELFFKVNRQLTLPAVDAPGGAVAEVAVAKLAVICFDYDQRRAVAFPEAVREEMQHAQG